MLLKILNKKLLKALMAAMAITALYSFWLMHLAPIKTINCKLIDLFYILRYKATPLPEEVSDFVILAIDDGSFNKLNLRWPWPRGLIGEIIAKVASHHPRVICLDLDLGDMEQDKSGDDILAEEIKKAGNVILASRFSENGAYLAPDVIFSNSAAAFGFIDKPRDIDGVTRRARPVSFSPEEGVIDYSLGLKAARLFLGMEPNRAAYKNGVITMYENSPAPSFGIQVGKDNVIWMNYIAGAADFDIVPIWKILKNEVPEQMMKAKIVFIGKFAEAFHDVYYTPFGVVPGVLLDVNETLMYVSRSFIRDMPQALRFSALFLPIFIIVISGYFLDIVKAGLAFAAVTAASILSTMLFFIKGLMPDIFAPFFVPSAVFLGFYMYQNMALLMQNVRLRNEAVKDGLTQFYIFKFFELKLKKEFERSVREARNLTVLIIDVDDFKKINDTYGHEQGNVVLKSAADSIRANSRKQDIIARFTGTSFSVYMADAGFHGALRYADHVRREVEGLEFVAPKGGILKVTVSIGIATLQGFSPKDSMELMEAADAALYRAKHTGKNKVCLFDKNVDVL